MSIEIVTSTAQDIISGNLEKAIMTLIVIMGGCIGFIYASLSKHKINSDNNHVKITYSINDFRKDVSELKGEMGESVTKLDRIKGEGELVKEKVQVLEIKQISHIGQTEKEIDRVNKQLDEMKLAMIDNHKEVISFIRDQGDDINQKVDVINQSLQRILGGMDGVRGKK